MNYLNRLKFENDKKFFEQNYKSFSLPLAQSCIDFIELCCFTYDPRRKKKKIPFFLYPKQKDFIKWLWKRYRNKENGVVNKCRDVGASWVIVAFSVWMLIFQKEISVGLYSYKTDAVDKRGEIDSLMEKANFIIENLPDNINHKCSKTYMLIKNGISSITGLSGEEARGGRKSILFKDESAFYEHPEIVEAALSEVSDCIIDISTHSGTDSLFYNKIESGALSVFDFEWRDNPNHTIEWYEAKKKQYESQGLLHIFEREINRNPQASISSVVMPAICVNAARMHEVINTGKKTLGFDVADDGSDMKAFVAFHGNDLIDFEAWVKGDVEDATEYVYRKAKELGIQELRYDAIGVGAGAKVKFNQISKEEDKIKIIGWNAGGQVMRPDESDFEDRENKELFENAKAQAYWKCREEFLQTFRMTENKEYDKNKVIHIANMNNKENFGKLLNQLSQPQFKLSASGKIQIDKKAGKKSPDLCEAWILARAEVNTSASIWD